MPRPEDDSNIRECVFCRGEFHEICLSSHIRHNHGKELHYHFSIRIYVRDNRSGRNGRRRSAIHWSKGEFEFSDNLAEIMKAYGKELERDLDFHEQKCRKDRWLKEDLPEKRRRS